MRTSHIPSHRIFHRQSPYQSLRRHGVPTWMVPAAREQCSFHVCACKVSRKPNRLIIGSWNLEGLTDIKLHEICMYMKSQSVDIMCIQEVRKKNSDKFISDDGYTVLWSGSGDGSREWAGVGFIISPSLQPNFLGFRPLSNRIAALKLSVSCGSMVVFSVYAPHNLKPLPERVSFYDDLTRPSR